MIVAQESPLDDVSVVAALLHDVIEDCEDYTYADLSDEFGSTVADIVEGATKISTILVSKEITKAENYRKLIPSDDWFHLVNLANEKTSYITKIIEADTRPKAKIKARKAYRRFVETVAEYQQPLAEAA